MQVNLIWQANCHVEGSKATLWLILGEYDADSDDEPYPDEDHRAIRLVGPIDSQLCAELQGTLAQVLRDLGHQVNTSQTADD